MRSAYATVATCLVLGTAACGEGESEEAEVASAYNGVVEAVAEKDYDRACEGLTDRTRQDLEKAATIERTDKCGSTLERVVSGVGAEKRALRTVAATDVQMAGETSATVDNVRMFKEGDDWRVEGDLDFVRPFLSGPARPR